VIDGEEALLLCRDERVQVRIREGVEQVGAGGERIMTI